MCAVAGQLVPEPQLRNNGRGVSANAQFFHQPLTVSTASDSAEWDYENLGIDGKQRKIMPMALWLLKKYEIPVHKAFEETNGKFEAHRDIEEMISRSEDIARLGNQAGEGWYLDRKSVV